MKKEFLLFIFLFNLSLQAQQVELLETTWYLDKLVLSGDDYLPPSNEEAVPSSITAQFFPQSLTITSGCNTMEGEIMYQDANNTFDVSENGWSVTLMQCWLDENQEFENLYFYEFYSDSMLSDVGTFQYHLEEGSEGLGLIVTKENGDEAHYQNYQMTIYDHKDSNAIQLVFQKDELIISSPNIPLESVAIFDLNGKVVLNSTMYSTNKIKTQLPKGVYIVQVKDEKERIYSKKVMKE